jgi:BMFP domain-containing protein YqiC
VPFGIGLETLDAYKRFEFDIRDAITTRNEKELRKRVELAISKLERTFCPQQKEVNKNAS